MSGLRKCATAAFVCLLGMALAASSAQATIIGPGVEASTTGVDSAERLNIDRTITATLAAGTYQITDFSFFATANAGTVTPLLATLTNASTNEFTAFWIGDAVDSPATAYTAVSVDPTASITLTDTTTLYAGFFTSGGGRVAYDSTVGLTAHDNEFTAPTSPGDVISNFSHPTLVRTYAFSLTVVPEPSTWVMLGVVLLPSLGLWFGWPKRGPSHVE